MKNQELKVGDRIELFQVINPSKGYEGDYPIGITRKGEEIGSICYMDTIDCTTTRPMYIQATYLDPQEVKPIGAMIIKALKNK